MLTKIEDKADEIVQNKMNVMKNLNVQRTNITNSFKMVFLFLL